MHILSRAFAVPVLLVGVCLALCKRIWPFSCCERLKIDTEVSVGDCSNTGELKDLPARGFAVIHNFLPPSQVYQMQAFLNRSRPKFESLSRADEVEIKASASPHYKYTQQRPGETLPDEVAASMQNFTLRLHSETNVRIPKRYEAHATWIHQGFQFISVDPDIEPSPLHGDQITELLGLDLFQKVSIAVVIEKSHPNKAGMRFLPYDFIRKANLQWYEGAVSKQKIWDVVPDGLRSLASDEMMLVDTDMTNAPCAPETRVGDLMIFMGDTLHGTQPTGDDMRTHLYFRVENEDSVNCDALFSGGLGKFTHFAYGDAHHDFHSYGVRCVQEKYGLSYDISLWYVKVYFDFGVWLRLLLCPWRFSWPIADILGDTDSVDPHLICHTSGVDWKKAQKELWGDVPW